ncbi:MAG: YciI family protein [Actinomycetota bacterium]
MKYAILIYGEESGLADAPQETIDAVMAEWWGYEGELQKAGAKLAGEALQPTTTGKSVRMADGKVSVSDGPFAETKEQLGGFYLIEAKDEAQAVEWAAKCPGSKFGTIEVRPVQEFEPPQ